MLLIAEFPEKGKSKRIRMRVPYCCIISAKLAARSAGNSPRRIFSPSSGYTGTRLKTARLTLSISSGIRIALKAIKGVNLISNEMMSASARLLSGPASEMMAPSRRLSRKLNGSKGTGFPQPKPTNRIASVPSGSRCARGLSVRRPRDRGVGSPSLSAARACANS